MESTSVSVGHYYKLKTSAKGLSRYVTKDRANATYLVTGINQDKEVWIINGVLKPGAVILNNRISMDDIVGWTFSVVLPISFIGAEVVNPKPNTLQASELENIRLKERITELEAKVKSLEDGKAAQDKELKIEDWIRHIKETTTSDKNMIEMQKNMDAILKKLFC